MDKKSVPFVDYAKCRGCQPCDAKQVCSTHAIVQIDRGEPVYIANERCRGCAACIAACPYQALVLDKGWVVQVGINKVGGC